jgi:16S rRNA (adenine1518-N6/adenine1519-N6)-dimethyltransferase
VADGYLDARRIRALAAELGLNPSKGRGQNFVIDANTIRRIVAAAVVGAGDVVMEIGPGLGSLTAGLLATGARVVAVEIEPVLAQRLPQTMEELQPGSSERLHVVEADALTIVPADIATAVPADIAAAREVETEPQGSSEGAVRGGPEGSQSPQEGGGEPNPVLAASWEPDVLVANLPYNVAVPVLLTVLERWESVERGLVMVQREVAERLVAGPGSKTYGVPSAKLAWHAESSFAGVVAASVFWPAPNVESGLVRFQRHPAPAGADRKETFALIDAAFAQRRKMLRSGLAARYGADKVVAALAEVGLDAQVRGERLTVGDFARLSAALGRQE